MRSHFMRTMRRRQTLQLVGSLYSASGGSDVTSRVISLNGTLSGGIGSAPSADDLVIVAVGTDESSNTDLGATGYTELVDLYANAGVSQDPNLGVFYKRLTGSDLSVTITSSSAAIMECVVFVVRGSDDTSPIDVTTVSQVAATSAKPDPPSITPVTPGAMVLAVGVGVSTNAAVALTHGGLFSLREGGDTYVRTAVGIASSSWSAGAVNPAAFTGGGTLTGAASATIAIRPGY